MYVFIVKNVERHLDGQNWADSFGKTFITILSKANSSTISAPQESSAKNVAAAMIVEWLSKNEKLLMETLMEQNKQLVLDKQDFQYQ